jgi:hypothetical protein
VGERDHVYRAPAAPPGVIAPRTARASLPTRPVAEPAVTRCWGSVPARGRPPRSSGDRAQPIRHAGLASA